MIDRTEKEIMQKWKGDLSTPLVSICTITYNHENFIEEALDSFLMQETDFPFEIVIDDDASPDHTADIIKKYIEKYPKIFNARLRDKNVGSITNFIENMQRANGKYIAICDGDDFWTDCCKLKKQINFLELHNDYVMVGANVTLLDMEDTSKRTLAKNHNVNELDFFDKDFLLLNPIPNMTLVFRNNLISKYPEFYYQFRLADQGQNLMLTQYGKCKYFNDIVGVNRRYRGSITSLYREKDYNKKIFTIEEEISFIKTWNEYFDYKYDDIVYPYIHRRYARLVELYCKVYQFNRAMELASMIDIKYLNNSKKKERSNSSSQGSINKILTDENRYKGDKLIIEDAIREEDWETLEDMLKSRTSDFPDLIKMIKKALNNRK